MTAQATSTVETTSANLSKVVVTGGSVGTAEASSSTSSATTGAVAPPTTATIATPAPQPIASMTNAATSTTTTDYRTTVGTTATTPTIIVSPATAAISSNSAVAAGAPSNNKSSKKKKAQLGGVANGGQGASGENTGRWTAEEHRLFLQGLEQHGKGWKKIASLIKSRTVVQIRTHAQKYFQKLAKARQNGEEGDVTMEGRGGVATAVPGSCGVGGVGPGHPHAQAGKRRRQTTGTKRKAIQSVVASAQRQAKKIATSSSTTGAGVAGSQCGGGGAVAPRCGGAPILPNIAPTLAHFVLPQVQESSNADGGASSNGCVQSITRSQGIISGPALEDSLFRFLTPVPIATSEPQLNDVARQAGANPITLPSEYPSSAPLISGEVSPTGVADLPIHPSWKDAKDTPSWYSKGADVDALLDVADTLDWLTDTGDLNDAYEPSAEDDEEDEAAVAAALEEVVCEGVEDEGVVEEDSGDFEPAEMDPAELDPTTAVDEPPPPLSSETGLAVEPALIDSSKPAHNTSSTSLPRVDSNNMDSVVPALPSLFDHGPPEEATLKKALPSANSTTHLDATVSSMDLQVFDTAMEEHDFVSTILEEDEEETPDNSGAATTTTTATIPNQENVVALASSG